MCAKFVLPIPGAIVHIIGGNLSLQRKAILYFDDRYTIHTNSIIIHTMAMPCYAII